MATIVDEAVENSVSLAAAAEGRHEVSGQPLLELARAVLILQARVERLTLGRDQRTTLAAFAGSRSHADRYPLTVRVIVELLAAQEEP